jgi:RNA polymerase sigma factor (sigma-70 family)
MGNPSLQRVMRHIRQLADRRTYQSRGGPGHARQRPETPASDRDLLTRYINDQDKEAIARLVRRHGPMVRGVCQRLLDQEADRDDVFQATFLVLLHKARSIRKRHSVGSWLYGVAYRIALKARASRARNPKAEIRATDETQIEHGKKSVFHPCSIRGSDLDFGSSKAESSDPSRIAAWRELCALLDEELHRLSERYRSPLVLCYLAGQTQEEAAGHLGWSLRTLKRRLERGKEILRLRLSRCGLTLSSTLLIAGLSQQEAAASVPIGLTLETIKEAALVAAGKTASASISANTLALTQATLKSLAVGKLKCVLVCVLFVGLAAAGAGLAVQQMVTPKPALAKLDEAPPPKVRTAALPSPKEEKPIRTDRYGDALPEGVLARLGTARFRHGVVISALAFSPDGKTLASGTHTGTIRLWDAATGKELHLLTGHGGGIYSLAFTPDNKTLASGSWDKTIRLWDVATGRQLQILNSHQNWVLSVAFSPDGKSLASGSGDNTIRLWDPGMGKELQQLQGHRDWVRAVAFSKDGKALVSGSYDKTVRVWEVSTGKETRALEGHDGKIETVAIGPDGKTVASAGQDQTIRLWDMTTGEEIRRLREHSGTVSFVAFSPDGKSLASTSHQDNSVRRWEIATGKELSPTGHQRGAQCLAYSPDGKTLTSGGWDCIIRFWDPVTGKELQRTLAHQDAIWKVAFSPDGKLLATASWDKTVRLWDRFTGNEIRQLKGHQESARCVAFSPDGKILASGSNDQTIRLWAVESGKETRCLKGENRIKSVAFSPDGKLLACAGGEDLIGGEQAEQALAEQPVGPGEVRLWDVATGRQVLRWQSPQGGVQSVAFSPDGKWLAAGGNDSMVHFWDIASGREVRRSQAHQSAIQSIAFSPDGKVLASAGLDGMLALWNVTKWDPEDPGEQVRAFKGPPGPILGLAFSPDSKTLATAHWPFSGRSTVDDPPDWGNPVRLLEVATGKDRGGFKDPLDRCNGVAFSPDGLVLASAGQDSTTLLWDATGRLEDGRLKPANLGPDQLKTLWADLAGDDAVKAYRAIWTLAAASDQAVPFLEKHLQAAPRPAEAKRLIQLIAELDDDAFAVREKAAAELEKLGELAAPALRKALEAKPSAEVRLRVRKLLDKFDQGISFEQLRTRRAIEALEHAGSQEAKQLLQKLAPGESEAKAALERLTKRKIEKR